MTADDRATARITAVGADFFPPELARLRATATRALDLHTNRNGPCADCGCARPCARAALAEHNLSLI